MVVENRRHEIYLGLLARKGGTLRILVVKLRVPNRRTSGTFVSIDAFLFWLAVGSLTSHKRLAIQRLTTTDRVQARCSKSSVQGTGMLPRSISAVARTPADAIVDPMNSCNHLHSMTATPLQERTLSTTIAPPYQQLSPYQQPFTSSSHTA